MWTDIEILDLREMVGVILYDEAMSYHQMAARAFQSGFPAASDRMAAMATTIDSALAHLGFSIRVATRELGWTITPKQAAHPTLEVDLDAPLPDPSGKMLRYNDIGRLQDPIPWGQIPKHRQEFVIICLVKNAEKLRNEAQLALNSGLYEARHRLNMAVDTLRAASSHLGWDPKVQP